LVKAVHVIPHAPVGEEALMVAGMVQGIRTPASAAWLDWIKSVFDEFGAIPDFGGCTVGENTTKKEGPLRSYGAFHRIEKKTRILLENKAFTDKGVHLSFDTLPKGTITDKGNGDVMAIIDCSEIMERGWNMRNWAYWSLRCPPAHDPLEVMQRMEEKLIAFLKPQYGFATFYPAIWKWFYPVRGTNQVPTAYSLTNYWNPDEPDNAIYRDRVWRAPNDREWSWRPQNGWLREVYSVNLVNDAHLARPLQLGPLKALFSGHAVTTFGDYMARHGSLDKNIHGSDLHRWYVPDLIINKVRNDLEHSGLILASETAPLEL
jgi:hypothetical protein